MRDTCRHTRRTVLSIIEMFFLAATTPLFAQIDLQIMVNGPWSYAPDPDDSKRVVLVAPQSKHHLSYIFAGTKASDFPNQPSTSKINPGRYTVEIVKRGGTGTGVINDVANVFAVTNVDSSRADDVARGKAPKMPNAPQPYAISIPQPDSYSTYVDPMGRIEGYSEAKVYMGSSSAGAPQLYTTWMVLHYAVKSLSDVKVTFPDGSSRSYTPTVSQPGVSIVSGDPNQNEHDNQCDYISLESLIDQNTLWDIRGRRGRFPMQTIYPVGSQIHYHYDYSCKDNQPDLASAIAPGHSEAGGSADCHTSQIRVNGAGPQ